MNVKHVQRRRSDRPKQSFSQLMTSHEKQLLCPICGEMVRVGGPNQHGQYTVMPHSPKHPTKPNDVCGGTNQTIKASPNT